MLSCYPRLFNASSIVLICLICVRRQEQWPQQNISTFPCSVGSLIKTLAGLFSFAPNLKIIKQLAFSYSLILNIILPIAASMP